MSAPLPPERCANELTLLLNAALGPDRFPVNVPYIAKEYTAQRFPDDPISLVKGDNLPNFDGALIRAPVGKKGWGIFYNSAVTSEGRINFTLAHELGHYLMHRVLYPDGFRCGEQDFVRWDSEYGQVEHQANVFAATLLMPLDDYRRQISANDPIDLDMLSHCADRYRVSLIAAVLRWLEYTSKRAILVVSRDGFILWARSSTPALKTRAYFRTSGLPIALPPNSLAGSGGAPGGVAAARAGVLHPKGVWLPEEAREMVVWSEQYSFAISVLLLPDTPPPYWTNDDEEEPLEDTFDRFMRR